MPPPSNTTTLTPTAATKSMYCELHFLQRMHGKGSDKTITVKRESDPTGHELVPLFGDTSHQEDFQKLMKLALTPPPKIPVAYVGAAPTERECFAAAQAYMQNLGYDVVDALGIDSKWNEITHRWDLVAPLHQAYGYVITDGTAPIETFVVVGADTLWVDFVIHLQY